MASAKERLRASRASLDAGFPSTAVREAADYEAGTTSQEQAEAVLVGAERFVSAVASMLPS
jgi:hypothetical protein